MNVTISDYFQSGKNFISPLASLPFCGLQKILQQLHLHLEPPILILIFLQRLCRLPSTKLRRTFGGFSALPFQQIVNRPVSLQSQFRFYLSVAHPCLYHAFYCRQQSLHLCVSSLAHNLSPLMFLLSYIRGDFVYCPVLLVLFIRAGGYRGRACCFRPYPQGKGDLKHSPRGMRGPMDRIGKNRNCRDLIPDSGCTW